MSPALPLVRIRSSRFAALAVAALVFAAALVAAATLERASVWRDRDIAIDGNDADWQGLMFPVKGQHFSLGISNDGQYLYLCLPTKDAPTRNVIANRGLIVWIDKAGGKKNQFGVHFPLGRPPAARRNDKGSDQGRDEGTPDWQEQLAILGPGLRDAVVVPVAHSGIEARVKVQEDLLVYELKVPLTRDETHEYAPNVKPGDALRVQLETKSIPGSSAPLGRLPGGVVIVGGGGRGGWGGGVGVGGGASFPPSSQMMRPLDLTMSVRLASGPAAP